MDLKLNKDIYLILEEIEKVIVGKQTPIKKILMAILAGGHILIDDIPGVGKTTTALAISKTMNLKTNRIQFTPDVLPSDITGFYMYNQDSKTFVLHQGPIVCNLFLADEINRTSPKTQSALLEVMAENKVTVDSQTITLPQPFIVIATQNPVGSIGTQMLPESQLDRFMINISLGYPDLASEVRLITDRHTNDPLEQVETIIDNNQLIEIQKIVSNIYIDNKVYEYIVRLANQTRVNELLQYGISPRGTLALCSMAKSCAFLANRDYVIPEDVINIFKDVAKHRIIISPTATARQISKDKILDEIINTTFQPSIGN